MKVTEPHGEWVIDLGCSWEECGSGRNRSAV